MCMHTHTHTHTVAAGRIIRCARQGKKSIGEKSAAMYRGEVMKLHYMERIVVLRMKAVASQREREPRKKCNDISVARARKM